MLTGAKRACCASRAPQKASAARPGLDPAAPELGGGARCWAQKGYRDPLANPLLPKLPPFAVPPLRGCGRGEEPFKREPENEGEQERKREGFSWMQGNGRLCVLEN